MPAADPILLRASTTVCIDCRSVLEPGQTCDGGPRHRAVDLSSTAGREALLHEVWGPPGLRRQAKRMVAAGGGGGLAGGLLEGTCGVVDCGGAVAEIPVLWVVLAVIGAAVLLYLLVAATVRKVQRRRQRLKPNGPRRLPLLLGQRYPGVAQVGERPAAAAAGAPRAVLASALQLRSQRYLGRDLMLVDGGSEGFEVRLADGRLVQVPAGRLRLQGPRTLEQPIPLAQAEAVLQRVDPQRCQPETAEELDPVPFDRATVLTLRDGDPVTLVGQLEPIPLEGAAGAPYREAAPTVLRPVGPLGVQLGARG